MPEEQQGRLFDTDHFIYKPPRPLSEFIPLIEENGYDLPMDVLDDHGEAIVAGRPDMYVVQGENIRADGKRFLELAINRDWIEKCTSYTYRAAHVGMPDLKYPEYECPDCFKRGGAHARSCANG